MLCNISTLFPESHDVSTCNLILVSLDGLMRRMRLLCSFRVFNSKINSEYSVKKTTSQDS
jgi:hypothetical protein